ncbi:MAG: hemolysin III family protein [Spirochaetia bacterium]|nr:hemolysin III family protein [Spirochaetia bacterium]
MAAPLREEKLNALTHGAALGASLLYTAWIMSRFARDQGRLMIVSSTIFCASMITLYAASFLYHLARDASLKRRLKVFDHSAIFVLIAGSYSPFTLAGLGGAWGWSLFGVVWALAAAGIVFKLFFTGRFKLVSTLLYVAMGWIIVIAAKPIMNSLPPRTIGWLIAGGLAYTLGTLFYMNKKLPFNHALWHGFVVMGTAGHALALIFLAYP